MSSELHNISRLTLPQLKTLPAKVLRLHPSSQNLVTTQSRNPGTTTENSSPNQLDNISLPSVNPAWCGPQPDDSVLVSGVQPTQPVPLPPVTSKLKQCISKEEYINFDQLLLETMFPSRYNRNTSPSITLHLSSDPSLSDNNVKVTQPHAANKCTTMDLSSWLEAWSVYATVIVGHYPARAIIAYQRIICDASAKFLPQAWLR